MTLYPPNGPEVNPPMLPHTKDELADLVYMKTGKSPIAVRTQALLVVADFADGTIGVWQIDELEMASRTLR